MQEIVLLMSALTRATWRHIQEYAILHRSCTSIQPNYARKKSKRFKIKGKADKGYIRRLNLKAVRRLTVSVTNLPF
jgi:hypothetical protein